MLFTAIFVGPGIKVFVFRIRIVSQQIAWLLNNYLVAWHGVNDEVCWIDYDIVRDGTKTKNIYV